MYHGEEASCDTAVTDLFVRPGTTPPAIPGLPWQTYVGCSHHCFAGVSGQGPLPDVLGMFAARSTASHGVTDNAFVTLVTIVVLAPRPGDDADKWATVIVSAL